MINLEKLQYSTRGYRRLEGVTGGFKWLREVTRGYRGLKGITESYKKLQGITRSYRKLHVQGVRGGYRGQQDITRGYGGKRILLHCRGPYMYKRLQGKRAPPPPPPRQRKNGEREHLRMARKGWKEVTRSFKGCIVLFKVFFFLFLVVCNTVNGLLHTKCNDSSLSDS